MYQIYEMFYYHNFRLALRKAHEYYDRANLIYDKTLSYSY